jgi:hypothetical protein
MGWADEWPDQCDRGHFLIMNARWVDDFGEATPLNQVKRMLVAAQDVEMVEFISNADEIKDVKLDDIKEIQKPLADMHKPKELCDERPNESTSEGSEKATGTVSPVKEFAATEISNGEPDGNSSRIAGGKHSGRSERSEANNGAE